MAPSLYPNTVLLSTTNRLASEEENIEDPQLESFLQKYTVPIYLSLSHFLTRANTRTYPTLLQPSVVVSFKLLVTW